MVLKNASGAEVDQTMECSLRYSNNVNVGKATVSACESMYYSSYIGGTSTSFNILPANINDAYFVPISDVSYTGKAIEPDVLVRFNGKTLVKGKDYDLSFSDNVKVGTAHVTVTGKGNFNGKHEITFKIVRPVITFDQDMVEGKTVSSSWTKKVNITNYRMVLKKGGMVRIRTSFSRIDTVLCSIQNENGDIIQSWSPSDGGDYGFFALPAGTYYFQYIGSPKSYGGSVYASYSVTPFSEPADTIYEVEDNSGTADGHTIDGDATPIEIGRCFAGSNYYAITGGYGDLDYFKFTVTKRGHYSMSLSTNARLMFALTDSQGHTHDNRDTGSGIVAQSSSDSLTGLDFGTLEPGTYYVLVLSKDKNAIGAAYYGCIFDSSDPAPTKKGVGRVSGNTRYDTMGSLTERGNWAKGGSVVLASGANYPDALAASSLAGGFNGPILLTDPNGLSTSAKDQLELLCPSRVFIVGGNAAVSPAVERQVKELLGSGCCGVPRLQGQTRYETSLVAAEINPKSSDAVIVATGGNYADALSVSPYAFASGSPVVLCDKSSGLTAGAMGTIRSKKYSKSVIVGGTAAVPAAVERQLRSAGVKNITRLSGATRYGQAPRSPTSSLSRGWALRWTACCWRRVPTSPTPWRPGPSRAARARLCCLWTPAPPMPRAICPPIGERFAPPWSLAARRPCPRPTGQGSRRPWGWMPSSPSSANSPSGHRGEGRRGLMDPFFPSAPLCIARLAGARPSVPLPEVPRVNLTCYIVEDAVVAVGDNHVACLLKCSQIVDDAAAVELVE